MKKVNIEPGICGFTTVVTASSEDGQEVRLEINSGCGHIQNMALELKDMELDAYEICFAKPGLGDIYEAAKLHCHHNACPVPCGIIKCIEAECALALPASVKIEFID